MTAALESSAVIRADGLGKGKGKALGTLPGVAKLLGAAEICAWQVGARKDAGGAQCKAGDSEGHLGTWFGGLGGS